MRDRGPRGFDAGTTSFANRFREGGQVVFVLGVGGESALVSDERPALRSGDPGGVHIAQIPRMRLRDSG
ncbi:hypothetical protein SMNI109538_14065 [Smaragdicoccus niigatensis]